jgi:hypothetical protein
LAIFRLFAGGSGSVVGFTAKEPACDDFLDDVHVLWNSRFHGFNEQWSLVGGPKQLVPSADDLISS